jgi:FG-GAP-like repeat
MNCKRALNGKSFIIVSLSVVILTCQIVRTQASSPQSATPPLFLPAVTYDSGGQGAMSAAVADVNGDGKPDLVVPNACSSSVGCSDSEQIGILLGHGDGTFQLALTYGSGGTSSGASVAIADLNGDGKPDVVVTNACGKDSNCTTGSLGVLLGNGDGTFQPAVTYGSGGYLDVSVAVADVNGDNKPDLLVTDNCADNACGGDGLVGVLLGNGDGSFQPVMTLSSGGKIAQWVAVADVNGDGKPDLLVANGCNSNCSEGTVGMLVGNGDGTFLPAVTYSSGGKFARSIAVADVNGDRKLDLLVANYCVIESTCSGGGPGAVDVLLGNGDGTFQPAATYSSGADDANSIAVADINGDGNPDLLVINQCADLINCTTGAVGVLLGGDDGTFQPPATYSSGGYSAQSIAVADVNGDNKPDLLVTNFSIDFFHLWTGAVSVLLNNSADTTPPVVTLFATATVLRLHRRKTVQISISGTITDTGSGVNPNSSAFVVKNEDGKVQQTGAITLDSGGKYSFTVLLPVSRRHSHRGHRYAVTVLATDNAGNRGSKTRVVSVPHDRGDEDD